MFRSRFYVRVRENALTVRDLDSGEELTLEEPFSHPRMLVGNFTLADGLLRQALRRLGGRSFLQLSPWILIHPMDRTEGGLSQVEERMFLELGAGTGASRTRLWLGGELDDGQALAKLSERRPV